MLFYTPAAFSSRFRLLLSSFLQSDGLPFAEVLPEAEIQRVFDEEQVSFGTDEGAVYTPALTLWAFLSQMLFKEEQRSCRAAVSRVIVLLVALGRPPCSDDTGAYCRARRKLSEVVLKRLVEQVGNGCEALVPRSQLWHGRHVRLVDGTTVSMPDTAENQKAYPQPDTQLPGVGFPLARMVVLMSLATAMICGMAIGPYAGKETGETALFRQLTYHLNAGDVMLFDRYFCSYFMLAMLMSMNVDAVTRLHQARACDFRRGQRLGTHDHLVAWTRPARPAWMSPEIYDQMPETITVRELLVEVSQPGFRTESFVVVTTLTDASEYSREEISELYHRRWMVELDIRAIKSTMGLDVLRCKTPEMVREEIWAGLLAYNLIRRTMAQSAEQAGKSPRVLSFAAGLQKVASSWSVMVLFDDHQAQAIVAAHLADLAKQLIGNRPDRVEPRAVKRRPKPHKLLNKPRHEAIAAILAGEQQE